MNQPKLSNIRQGRYVAVKYNTETATQIQQIQQLRKVPFPVKPEKLHTTIHYSRKWFHWENSKQLEHSYDAIGTLKVWNTKYGNTLVMLLSGPAADYMTQRHKVGRVLGAEYDFEEYIPHITLSYNVGSVQFNTDEKIPLLLNFTEYDEPLDDDLSLGELS